MRTTVRDELRLLVVAQCNVIKYKISITFLRIQKSLAEDSIHMYVVSEKADQMTVLLFVYQVLCYQVYGL